MNKLVLYKAVESGLRYPFILIETFQCVDGARTRVVRNFRNEEDANEFLKDCVGQNQ